MRASKGKISLSLLTESVARAGRGFEHFMGVYKVDLGSVYRFTVHTPRCLLYHLFHCPSPGKQTDWICLMLRLFKGWGLMMVKLLIGDEINLNTNPHSIKNMAHCSHNMGNIHNLKIATHCKKLGTGRSLLVLNYFFLPKTLSKLVGTEETSC